MENTYKLNLNQNIRIKQLRSGKKYLLVHNNNENAYPIFFKQDIIDYIIKITDKASGNDVIHDNGYDAILYEKNILVDENNYDEKVSYNSNAAKDTTKLRILALQTRTPLHTKFEITYNCNYDCNYCYINGYDKKNLSYDEIVKILNGINSSGVNDLYITGGEPFMHPDILKIIDYASTLDFDLNIQTNGCFITDEIAEKLSKYKNIVISISFHSIDENKFDSFTNVSGSYKQTINAINILKNHNITVLCKCCLTTKNGDEAEDIANFLKNLNVKFEFYTQILPNVNDSLDTNNFCISDKTMKWLIDNKYLIFSKSTCSAFSDKFWVSPLGDVYPCELFRHSAGNLLNDTFEDIWNNVDIYELVKDKLYKEDEKCKNCESARYCNKCLAYKYFDNWSDSNQYLKQFCYKAKYIKSMYCNANNQ